MRRKLPVWTLVCAGLSAGILIYNDPYFLFAALVPLAIAALYHYRHSKPMIAVVLAVCLASLGAYALLSLLFPHFGLDVGKIDDANALVRSMTPLSELPRKTVQVFNGYLSLLGITPSSSLSGNWLVASAILNGSVLCMGVVILCRTVREHALSPLTSWTIATFIVTFFYLVASGEALRARYLLILLPFTALFISKTASNLLAKHRKYYSAVMALVAAAMFLNILHASVFIYQKRHASETNKLDYQLAAAFHQNGITKAYADYWIANVTYYFSDYSVNALPTICAKSRLYIDPTLVDAKRYGVQSDTTGIVVDPGLVVPSQSTTDPDSGCTVRTTIKQFGTPLKSIHVSHGVEILVYHLDPQT